MTAWPRGKSDPRAQFKASIGATRTASGARCSCRPVRENFGSSANSHGRYTVRRASGECDDPMRISDIPTSEAAMVRPRLCWQQLPSETPTEGRTRVRHRVRRSAAGNIRALYIGTARLQLSMLLSCVVFFFFFLFWACLMSSLAGAAAISADFSHY